jgi:hypothetical protein
MLLMVLDIVVILSEAKDLRKNRRKEILRFAQDDENAILPFFPILIIFQDRKNSSVPAKINTTQDCENCYTTQTTA